MKGTTAAIPHQQAADLARAPVLKSYNQGNWWLVVGSLAVLI
jgi:hypothetical protein